ncbi:MAG: lamin tail domain-containing protein [bacterium]|nr:lamin tail domain-containing protein [bacterium]
MIFINEWLSNPTGDDTSGEFVELFNNGNTLVSLNGWILKTSGKRELKLSGTVDVGQYLLLERSDTKLVLKNSDEKLFLYDGGGKLVDGSEFLGTAPEGKSLARRSLGEGGLDFVFADPTPGAENKTPFATNITRNTYPSGALIKKTLEPTEFWSLLLGTAVVLTAIIVFASKQNENLSKLFFGGDPKIR